MVRKTKVAVVEHPRGGEGSVEFHHIVSEEELNGHGSMYAMAVLRPHSSVGWHQPVSYTHLADLFTNQTDKFQSLPVFKGASSMYDTLYKNMQSMMLGELTPEEVLKNTTEYYDSNLK